MLDKLGLSRWHACAIAALLLVWVAIIVASGAGWNPFARNWNFANSGAFGDSFAPISAIMALLAAIGAIGAYRVQSDEINRVRAREAEQDRISQSDRARSLTRQESLDLQSEMQIFEQTFFQLLKSHRELVLGLDLVEESTEEKHKGHDVFRVMLRDFRTRIGKNNKVSNVAKIWIGFSDHFRNDINHYFRMLYHIVRFIDNSSIKNRYFYIQILRASLSDSELALLALNCEYGEGRDKFKVLIEHYALLHNLSEKEVTFWKLRKKFHSGAFQYAHGSHDFDIFG